MKGIKFPEATLEMGAPEGMEDKVYGLPVWRVPNSTAYISKWRMTWKERLSCLFFGHVWLHVVGNSHPLVHIETRFPFEKDKK